VQVTVVYRDGTWSFEVTSGDDDDPYCEYFELTDLDEARNAAWDLMEEIARLEDPIADAFGDLFDEEDI
jgi:hypothetical protein